MIQSLPKGKNMHTLQSCGYAPFGYFHLILLHLFYILVNNFQFRSKKKYLNTNLKIVSACYFNIFYKTIKLQAR